MKCILFFTPILFSHILLFAQVTKPADYTGHYQVDFYPSRKLNVTRELNRLFLEIVGQGKTELIPLQGNLFKPKLIPASTIEFIRDSLGETVRFKWINPPSGGEFIRVADIDKSAIPGSSPENLTTYEGKYVPKGNRYNIMLIRAEADHLISQIPGETSLDFYELSKNKFIFKKGEFSTVYEFIADKRGNFTKIKTTQTGRFYCSKISDSAPELYVAKHSFSERSGFTRADTLRGMLSPMRTCYDVAFYDLDVKIDPDSKSLEGRTKIRFRAMRDFSIFQVDLFAIMKIEKILFHNEILSFKRLDDAVFVQFPDTLKKGTVEEIQIMYSGKPQDPDIANLAGGFIWMKDKNGKPWIESVVQGSGASLWWPCKDHLSDKPDSMHISVTIPAGLTAVANGSFIGKTMLPDSLVRFQWAVHYPINNYNAVLYIGDYVHASDEYDLGTNRFPLNYYFLSYHAAQAAVYARQVRPMLDLYQNDFGPYPFPKDGYALVESPYGMEHQSAVSIGPYANAQEKPINTVENIRTLWHESAHEWWGNSVTCNDMADFWIHESFATYAEVLCYEKFHGMAAAEKYLKEQDPGNKEPIIGFYDVNDFHMGDMYSKGCRMIATLRTAINNDILFFSILRGIQKKYKYQSINTADIVSYFNTATGTDYTNVFDQYLRYGPIPKLIISTNPSGKDLDLRYKWVTNVKDFRLPAKLSVGSKEFQFIYPTNEWKTIHLENCRSKDLHFDTVNTYFDLQTE